VSRHLNERDFSSELAKWKFLEAAPAIDAKEPKVRELASALNVAAQGDARRFVRLAMAYCRDVIQYETDTDRVGIEDIQPAGELSDIIERGVDDCDGLARLFVALCLARGGIRAEMRPGWKKNEAMPGGQELAHVFAHVWEDGAFHTVELTLERARFGDPPRDVPKEVTGPRTGHWLRNEAPR
jgi:transglutaminase-like putative cysteine protease